jgi:hypothetical protein
MKSITEWMEAWRAWALTANRVEDGWQSDFDAWPELVESVQRAMLGPFEAKQFSDVEGAWAAAEEGEGLVDFARAHLSDVRSWLCALARSRFPSVRWQVYASLSGATGYRGPRTYCETDWTTQMRTHVVELCWRSPSTLSATLAK